MFGMPGHIEIIIIGIVAILLFGSRLPSLARGFGQSIVEFRKGFREIEKECLELEKDIKGLEKETSNGTS